MPVAMGIRALLPKLIQLAKTSPDKFRQLIQRSPKLRKIFEQAGAGASAGAGATGRGFKRAGDAFKTMPGKAKAGAQKAKGFAKDYGQSVGQEWNKLPPRSRNLYSKIGKGVGTGVTLGAGFQLGSNLLDNSDQNNNLDALVQRQLLESLGIPPDTPPEVVQQLLNYYYSPGNFEERPR